MKGQHFAIYGNVVIQREYCPHCHQHAFVSDGKLACCGAPTAFDSHQMKRMSLAEDVRRTPSADEKRQILEIQGGRCLYCQRLFNTPVVRKDRLIWLKVNWDHWIPYSYSQNNYPYNFVAACQICNGIKSNLMFTSTDEARVYVQALWDAKELAPEGDGDETGKRGGLMCR
ncbi:MAG TPA: hypothetical protein VIB49_10755 [Thermoplasmata archaeon]|jgi:hypothetical protein